MNDYDDEFDDPHASDPAFSYNGGGLGEELLEAVSPDASFDGGPSSLAGTPRKGGSSAKTTTLEPSLQGESLADELGGGVGAGAGAGTLGDELDFGDEEVVGNDASDNPLSADENDEARAAAQDARYEAISASLAESVRITQSFLEQLQGVSGRSSASTSGMPASASFNSINSADGTSNAASSSADERLELTGNQIVLNLRQAAKERDSQVRELQEILRTMSKPDPAMQVAIAETWVNEGDEGGGSDENRATDMPSWLQPVSSLSTDELGLGLSTSALAAAGPSDRGTPLSPIVNQHPTRRLQDLIEEDDDDYDSRDAGFSGEHADTRSSRIRTTSTQAIVPPGPSRKAPVSAHLQHLQVVTTSLLSSLGHLNESSQISQASFRDATKQLRKLRNGLGDWKREVDLAEKSHRWIEEHGEELSSRSTHALAQKELTSFEARYDECLIKARQLLKPVQSTVIDSAMDAFRDRVEAVTAGIVV